MSMTDVSLRGKHALVLGLAKSGFAAAQLLLKHGASVTVNERRDESPDDDEAKDLHNRGVRLIFGGHPVELLDEEPFDFIVKNPGIPYQIPFLEEAARRGIPIYTEVEVASWFCRNSIYAITGSNGKTTTTTLVGEILKHANLDPVVAGNIGTAFSGLVEDIRAEQPIVLELSSFQLMGIDHFAPRVGAILNVSPAHLDYHGTFDAYVEAKWRLVERVGAEGFCVLNRDQPELVARSEDLLAHIFWFSRKSSPFEWGVSVEDDVITLWEDRKPIPVLPSSEVALRGEHNLENALAAVAISYLAGASVSVIGDVLRTFSGVEHRLEFVRTKSGVTYINDSKATNAKATGQALKAITEPVVWIAGGLDRGVTFDELEDVIHNHVVAAVLLGESQAVLEGVCQRAGVQSIVRVDSLDDAVQRAAERAESGDVVLLSPACASWDMFTSFEERGRIFKEAVHRL